MMKSVLIGLTTVAFLVGCGSKNDANEKNFKVSINQYFEKDGDLCTYSASWPLDVRKDNSSSLRAERDLKVLETEGLLAASDLEIDQLDNNKQPNGKKDNVRRYELTNLGQKFFKIDKPSPYSPQGTGQFCYGKKAVDKVVKWDVPASIMGTPMSTKVIGTYKIENLADWAKKPEIQKAFPDIAKGIAEAEKKNNAIQWF